LLTVRERFILVWLLKTLNEYAGTIRGAEEAVPDKNIQEMQEARVRNLSNQDRQEIISEIKQELMITDSFLTTTSNQQEFPGDGKLV
jgi:hypothetical protein